MITQFNVQTATPEALEAHKPELCECRPFYQCLPYAKNRTGFDLPWRSSIQHQPLTWGIQTE